MESKKMIASIKDEDFNIEAVNMKNYKTRYAARGIIVRKDGKIAVQLKKKKNEYKLIGGGIEKEENAELAFKREALEEAGCTVKIIANLGIIEEKRSLENLNQISYIYLAEVATNKKTLNLTDEEKTEEAVLKWFKPQEALKLIKNSFTNLINTEEIDTYNIKFIIQRDTKILEYYLKYQKEQLR